MGRLTHLNVGCADCSVITTSANTYLIDTHGIESHAHLLPSSKRIRGVFITHQHYDHFDGLRFLKSGGYSIDFLIYSPYERRQNDPSVQYEEWREFQSLKDYFVGRGTETRNPLRQDDFAEAWWDAGEAKFWILGPSSAVAKSSTRELHDACLVVHAKVGSRKCLFTGDASDTNLDDVAKRTTNMCGDILHASHHGSLAGASLEFIKKCEAEYTVVSTKSGVYQNVPHPTALSRYGQHTAKRVYRTDCDGTVTWDF